MSGAEGSAPAPMKRPAAHSASAVPPLKRPAAATSDVTTPEIAPEPDDTDEVPPNPELTDDQLKNGENVKIKPGTDRLYYVNGKPPYRVMDYHTKSVAAVTFHYRDTMNRAKSAQIANVPPPHATALSLSLILSLQLGTASATTRDVRFLEAPMRPRGAPTRPP